MHLTEEMFGSCPDSPRYTRDIKNPTYNFKILLLIDIIHSMPLFIKPIDFVVPFPFDSYFSFSLPIYNIEKRIPSFTFSSFSILIVRYTIGLSLIRRASLSTFIRVLLIVCDVSKLFKFFCLKAYFLNRKELIVYLCGKDLANH